MTTTKQYMAIEIVSLPLKIKRSTDRSPRIFSVTAQVHVNNDDGAALFLFQYLVMTWITNSTQYIKKSPSIKAIAHDLNELAQAVKDDGRAKRLIWQNNHAIEKELIASGVNFHKPKVWRNFLVFWKTVKQKMQESDEYRRWLESSAEESRRMSAVASLLGSRMDRDPTPQMSRL
jgi:hypothetical protein